MGNGHVAFPSPTAIAEIPLKLLTEAPAAFLTDNSNNGGDCNSDVDGGDGPDLTDIGRQQS